MDTAQYLEYFQNRGHTSIGGYWGRSFAVEIAVDDDSLIYKTYGDQYILEETRKITPTAKQWDIFWVEINKLNIGKWKKRYTNPGMMDGTSWKATIVYKNISLYSSGSNSFPESTHDGSGKVFDRFLKAVSDLLGKVPFH